MTDRGVLWRMLILAFAVTGAWTALGVRLAFLHLGPNDAIREEAEQAWRFEREMLGARGRIVDANGATLAQDLGVKHISISPKHILKEGQSHTIASHLSMKLGIGYDFVMNEIRENPTSQNRIVKRFVPMEEYEVVERMGLGYRVYTTDVSARYYPNKTLAAQVIGFSNFDGDGSLGVEQAMDDYLRGRAGLRAGYRDRDKREVYLRRTVDVPPRDGCTIVLTLDMNVQYLVEEGLRNAMREHRAKGAWGVVQEVKTGRILAMASLPSFDLNAYGQAREEEKRNRCISYTYEPGSTMKAAVFAAAFNEGLISEHGTIFCENGAWYYRGRPLRDFHPYGTLTVADVLKKSSNIGTAKIALGLGEERLDRYLRAFGLGTRTGIGFGAEETGVLRSRDKWDSLSITRFPMGHGLTVTALQMVSLYSTIANRGYRMQPYIVDRIIDADGNVVMQATPEVVSAPIREDTARLMCRLLKRVSEDGGTARRARVEGYSVAGKTGTAEKVVNGHYSEDANIASFAGFLPAENPEISLLIVVDEPQPLHTGGTVAAPVFAEICEKVVRCLNIPPAGNGWTSPGPRNRDADDYGQVAAIQVH